MSLNVKDAAKVTRALRTYSVDGELVSAHVLDPATSGGLSMYRNIDLGSTGQVVKNEAGQLYGYFLFNASSGTLYFKFYDKATAATSSDTPKLTLPIPAGGGANVSFPIGLAYASGISVRCVTGVADNNTTSPGSNEAICNVLYY
jgi:hypothetical protein